MARKLDKPAPQRHNFAMAAAALLSELSKPAPARIRGQLSLDFDERHKMKTKALKPAEITPLQRARMKAAALAIKEGRKHIPLRCAFCQSTSLANDGDPFQLTSDYEAVGEIILSCAACGRLTRLSTARKERKREIMAFIRAGIDLPPPSGKRKAS
jgi:hypothetical protein